MAILKALVSYAKRFEIVCPWRIVTYGFPGYYIAK